MKVLVYRNLNKGCYSVKAMEGVNKGRVIAHEKEVYLTGAYAKVSEKGRQRVLKEGQRNVHAGLFGEWSDPFDIPRKAREIRYNPYKYKTFVYVDDQTEFIGGDIYATYNTVLVATLTKNT